MLGVLSQTSADDRRSLLTLQNIVRNAVPDYTYMEIGSFLGGTLLPHLSDPRCRSIYSIDKRPETQPDERGRNFDFPNNSTTMMISGLSQLVPMASMLKLCTIDTDSSLLSDNDITMPCDFLFIDAEHTNQAVFSDFISLRRFTKPDSVVAFHDSELIFDALVNIETLLKSEGMPFRAFMLPGSIFVLLFGKFSEFPASVLSRIAVDKDQYFVKAKKELWLEIARNNPIAA